VFFSRIESRRNSFVCVHPVARLDAVEGHASLLLGRFTGVLAEGEVRGSM
jgi:hypothetical protein